MSTVKANWFVAGSIKPWTWLEDAFISSNSAFEVKAISHFWTLYFACPKADVNAANAKNTVISDRDKWGLCTIGRGFDRRGVSVAASLKNAKISGKYRVPMNTVNGRKGTRRSE